MSKLYGPDEGYEVVNSRSSLKKGVKKVENKQKPTQHVSMYSTVRGKISELICDQELVLHGPPFNPVVDLASLSHEQFVNRASRVITKLNPEGHPPPGVSSPTMMNLIDRLEISRNEDRPSYASVLRNSSSTSSPASVQSYRGSVLTEDRSSSDESAHIEHEVKAVPEGVQSLKSASSRKRKTPPKGKVQKARKKTVSFLTLDMERPLATNS